MTDLQLAGFLVAFAGGVWAIRSKLSDIEVTLRGVVTKVEAHEADIIDLKARRNRKKHP